MGAKISVLGLIMSFSQYLRSAMVQFPLGNINRRNRLKYVKDTASYCKAAPIRRRPLRESIVCTEQWSDFISPLNPVLDCNYFIQVIQDTLSSTLMYVYKNTYTYTRYIKRYQIYMLNRITWMNLPTMLTTQSENKT